MTDLERAGLRRLLELRGRTHVDRVCNGADREAAFEWIARQLEIDQRRRRRRGKYRR